ncbi:hypothetical protein GCM10027063_42550 [Promicromonospora xylanilytica]
MTGQAIFWSIRKVLDSPVSAMEAAKAAAPVGDGSLRAAGDAAGRRADALADLGQEVGSESAA